MKLPALRAARVIAAIGDDKLYRLVVERESGCDAEVLDCWRALKGDPGGVRTKSWTI